MENNSSLLEILTQYEVLILHRSKMLDLDLTITRVDLYRAWINGEISNVMLKIQKLCWNVIYVATKAQDSDFTLNESDEKELEKVMEDSED